MSPSLEWRRSCQVTSMSGPMVAAAGWLCRLTASVDSCETEPMPTSAESWGSTRVAARGSGAAVFGGSHALSAIRQQRSRRMRCLIPQNPFERRAPRAARTLPVMNALDELATILRPAGGGIFLFSTGKAEQLALQQRLYGAKSGEQVQAAFRERLARITSTRAVMLGIPSDVGAGFRRGANLGPQAIRLAMLERGVLPADLLDLGDVFVVPQLLHDEML